MKTHEELVSAHSAKLVELGAVKKRVLEQLDRERTDAIATHAADVEKLEIAHAKLVAERTRKFNVETHGALVKAIKPMHIEPSRSGADALARVWRDRKTEAPKVTGQPLRLQVLGHALAAVVLVLMGMRTRGNSVKFTGEKRA